MLDVLSVENMRNSDAHTIETLVSGKELMLRAGKGIFGAVDWVPPVGIVCGSGNNAGDGYVLALLLHEKGIDVTLLLLSEKLSEDGRYYYEKCVESGIKWEKISENPDFSAYKTIVDCILGTGFHGAPRDNVAAVIDAINESGSFVVSADINSGLNGDTGMAEKCVRSDLSVSIGSFKPGHFLNMAKDVMKAKVNCDIGIAPVDKAYHLFEAEDARKAIPARQNMSNKGTYGYVALIGGSLKYSGAIRLASMANAAMKSGAGVAMAAVPKTLAPLVIPQILESTVYPMPDKDGEMVFDEASLETLCKRVKTAAFGMGIGVTDETRRMLRYILHHFDGTLIVDADGLTMLSELDYADASCRLVLTPHLGEFSRLTKKSFAEINEAPMEYAKAHGVTLLLKGPSTIVTDGDEVYIVDRGSSGMATAGSGDVLSGILAATCAYIPDPLTAASVGAYINGRAGENAERALNPVSMTASDTVNAIPGVISDILYG